MKQNPNHVRYKKFQCHLNEKAAGVESKAAKKSYVNRVSFRIYEL